LFTSKGSENAKKWLIFASVINNDKTMHRTKKRLKTALCNGLKNWDKEQAENKPIFSTPNRLAKGRVQVFYILQAEEIGAYGR
jgi:hypothetical protein